MPTVVSSAVIDNDVRLSAEVFTSVLRALSTRQVGFRSGDTREKLAMGACAEERNPGAGRA